MKNMVLLFQDAINVEQYRHIFCKMLSFKVWYKWLVVDVDDVEPDDEAI